MPLATQTKNLQEMKRQADTAFQANQFEAAIVLYEHLMVRLELDANIIKRLSICYYRIDDYEQAVKHQRLALQLTQSDEDAFSLGLTLMRIGELVLADPYYQKRKGMTNLVTAKVPGVPLWRGQSALAGKTIMLVKEQGNGDLIQFFRYARALVNMGAEVLHWVHAPLRELMKQQQGMGRVLEKDEKVNVHYHAYYLDFLPYIDLLEQNISDPDAPYLLPDREKVTALSAHIRETSRPKVGLFWSGSVVNQRGKQRSIGLHQLKPLLQSPTGESVDFYALSNEKTQPIIDAAGLNIQDLSASITDFSELAAAVSQMDLVISIDSAGAHLAGALGCPVIVMIDKLCDWRWKIDKPWYQSMVLYQQKKQGDWLPVIAEVQAEFDQRIALLVK